jgi:hypothetical protein
MRYKKHFTFYANAPIDRANVDVAAWQTVLVGALEGLSVFDIGAINGGGATAQEWANFNFSPLQRTLFAPMPRSVNVNEINYLRVDFYDGEVTQDNDVPAHSFFYFVDDAKPDDEGESLNDDVLTMFAITLDPWATNVLYGNPRFFGGEITATSDITPERFPHVSGDALRASSVTFPFNTEKLQTSGAEQEAANIIPTDSTQEFRLVAAITGKNLGRTIFAVSETANISLKDAIAAGNTLCTAKKMYRVENDGNVEPQILETFNEGEFSLQGLWILPETIAPNTRGSNANRYVVQSNDNKGEPFDYFKHMRVYLVDIAAPAYEAQLNKRVDINFRELYARANGAETSEEIAEFLEDEFGGLRPCLRVDIGTLSNRIDITEQVFKNNTTQLPDAFINAVYGYQTFNIFLHVGGKKVDITNDFQAYTILDPENDFVKQNKTNSILSGLGSVGTIAGGVVALAGGAGAGVGVAAIAGGASSLASNIARWQDALSTPDVIKGIGYADTTNLYGGVFLTATRQVSAWTRAVVVNGFKTQVLTGGEWFLNPFNERRAGNCFCLSVDGARVSGMPAGDAEEIATLLRRGVRLWYDAAAWAERSI